MSARREKTEPADSVEDAKRINSGNSKGELWTVSLSVAIIFAVMATTVLVLLPSGTPLKRQVQSVATPYFSQNWRVFAPNILKVNMTFEFRAQWRNSSDELVKSDWVSLTDIESARVPGHVVTSRIDKNLWNASQQYLSRYNALDPNQQKRVKNTFIRKNGQKFEPIDNESLVTELGESDPAVIRFLRMDYMLTRHVMLYATAGFSEDIERVQWRLVRKRPNDFQHRFSDVQQFEDSVITFGWRQPRVSFSDKVLNEYRGLIKRAGSDHLFAKAAKHAE